jgi:lipopolysaccharide biosynthesis glycosyltransferase
MKAVCTIISPDFLPFAQCLYASLRRYDPTAELHVLVTSEKEKPQAIDGISFYSLSDINSEFLNELVKKYEGINDNLRWSLKPVFLLHLLQQSERVIYVDSDIHFFSDYGFLFDTLELRSFLLTPHFASIDPFDKEEKFMMNFLVGLYNAGFVGVSRKAIPTLKWWLKACLYNTSDDTANGFFVDQRYLDMVPVIDADATIVRHRGCNVGSWNMETYKRVIQPGGSVLINNHDPIVFIHFNHETTRHIVNGDDAALMPYYEQYSKTFSASGQQLTDFIDKLDAWKKSGIIYEAKRSLSIRTRIKRSLFNLAKKL